MQTLGGIGSIDQVKGDPVTHPFSGQDSGHGESPSVTVIVSPRERFGCAARSLASLASTISPAVKVIYLDAATPASVMAELERLAETMNLHFMEVDERKNPNELRNLGMEGVCSDYVCFVDNDVVFTEGWLTQLLAAAEEECADVAFPLYLIGEFESDTIHMAGGHIEILRHDGEKEFSEVHRFANQSYSKHKHLFRREESDYGEFHCLLAKTEVLRRLGPLDEQLPSLNEHLDLCMQVSGAGGTIIFEPASVVAYLAPSSRIPLWLSDVELYKERWSYENNAQSIRHFYAKWGFHLDEGSPPPALNFGNWARAQILDLAPRFTPQSTIESVINPWQYRYVHSFPKLAFQCVELGYHERRKSAPCARRSIWPLPFMPEP